MVNKLQTVTGPNDVAIDKITSGDVQTEFHKQPAGYIFTMNSQPCANKAGKAENWDNKFL